MWEWVSRDFNFLYQGSQGQKHLQRGANDHGRSFNYQSHSELTLQEIGTVSFRDNYTFNFKLMMLFPRLSCCQNFFIF